MRLCIDDIKDWMTDNKLKLNDHKTEVMIISSSRMSTALSIPESFDIGNASVPFSDTVKNLGVTLDCHLSLKTHVLNVVRTANFELRRISSIRRLLTTEATATLVSAFILSRLDYCNSLLSGCPRSLMFSSVLYQLLYCWMSGWNVLSMFCNCNNVRNNVLQQCICNLL